VKKARGKWPGSKVECSSKYWKKIRVTNTSASSLAKKIVDSSAKSSNRASTDGRSGENKHSHSILATAGSVYAKA